jgi:phosphoribosyl-ATP pyrophosphohydrolase
MFDKESRIQRLKTLMQFEAYRKLFPSGIDVTKDDIPLSKYYIISENRHVLVATSTPNGSELPKEAKDLFFSSAVLLSLVTAALAKAKTNLQDRESVNKILTKNQSTAHVGSYITTFDYSNSSLSISTALLKVLIKGLTPGASAIGIAEDILAFMGDSIKVALTNQQSTQKLAYVMFMTEYLMGVPMVTISVFWVIASDASFVTSSNCHSTSSQTIKSKVYRDDFLFIDPKWIADYGPGLVNTPAYDKMVEEFYKLLKD